MWVKIVIAVLGLVAIVATLGVVKGAQIGAMIEASKQAGPPPQAVAVTEAREEVWAPSLRAVGTVRAAQGVMVSAEVPGRVAHLKFESGQRVKTGAVLVELDASIERAQLKSAMATTRLARVTLKRQKRLAAQKVSARAELDAAAASADQAEAQVANIQAQIDKKTIRAPFDGQLGIRQVDLGAFLAAGTPIVSLQALDDVFVDFFLPQKDMSRIAVGQDVEVVVDAAPDRAWAGEIQSIEPAVDAATRNVKVRATFVNPDGALHPGMFVEVRVAMPAGPPVVVVPATAIVYAPYGNSVYVIEDPKPTESAAGNGTGPGAGPSATEASPSSEAPALPEAPPLPEGPPMKVARQVFVKLGERRGDFVAVPSGLKGGQQVVSAGAFKLRNGAPVVVDTDAQVDPQVAPKPEDS